VRSRPLVVIDDTGHRASPLHYHAERGNEVKSRWN